MKFLKLRDFIIGSILGILVFSFLTFIGDYTKIVENLKNIKFTTILILLLFSLANYFLRFVRWQFFLKIIGIKIELKSSVLTFLSGLSMALTPVKLGETLKSYLLYRNHNISLKRSLPIVFVERLNDVIGVALICLIGLFSLFFRPELIVGLVFLLLAVTLALRKESVFYYVISLVSKIPFLRNSMKGIRSFYKNLLMLISFRVLIISVILSIVSWAFEGIGLFFILGALGYDINILSVLFVYSFASIFGSLTFFPGGLGVTEGSMIYLLKFLGIPLDIAVLSTIVIRLTTLWFAVLIGVVCLPFVSKNRRAN